MAIIVQNLSVPMDRRVWQECCALRDAGWAVSVICPRDPGQAGFEVLDGVEVHRYRPSPATGSPASYLREFAVSWIRTARLTARVGRRRGLDVLQTCNPPDTYWALGLVLKAARGTAFVYDQHDLCPELYASRFGDDAGPLYRALLVLERMNYRVADQVIVANETHRQAAITRGRQDPAHVTVVRSGPDTRVMRPGPGDPRLTAGGRRLCCYLGVMGPQDGVDVLLDAWAHLVHDLGRRDAHLAVLGFGDCYDDLLAQAGRLGLEEHVTFTGRVGREEIERWLRSSEVGLSPDPLNAYNDACTTNKTMEYMAYGLPVVAFDLKETRVSAGDAGVYLRPGDVPGYARAVAALLADDGRRARLGQLARRRAVEVLDWQEQARAYVQVFDRLAGTASARSGAARPRQADVPGCVLRVEPARDLRTTPAEPLR